MSPSIPESQTKQVSTFRRSKLGANQSFFDPAVGSSFAEACNLRKFAIGENEVSGISLGVELTLHHRLLAIEHTPILWHV